MRTTLTKSELRQFFREDPCFLWFQAIIQEQFDHRKNLIGASDSDRLWQIKGHGEVLRLVDNPEILIELIDMEDE